MWLRLAQHCQLDFVNEALVQIRRHPQGAQSDQTYVFRNELAFYEKWATILPKETPTPDRWANVTCARVVKRFPERVINVGIMEQTAVSLAAGLALESFHPIIHSITPFVAERPFEQIKDDFCYQGLGGTFISIGASYDYGTDGMTHHGPADVPIHYLHL